MNKVSKILIMFFTVVCFILLVVFCVELILQNRGVERGVMQAPAAIEDDPEDEPPDHNDNDEYEPSEELPPEEEIPEPIFDRFDIPMPGEEYVLGMYVDINRFGHNTSGVRDWFVYSGGGVAFLDIQMIQIPEASENYAVEFLENQFDVQGVPDEGYTYMADSGLSGMYAIAIVGIAEEEELRYETWILAIPNTPNFGVAITIRYQDFEQYSALNAILDTMELLPLIDISDNDADADE